MIINGCDVRAMWCFIEEHDADGVHWGVSLGDGFNPRPERYIECADRVAACEMLVRLRMGLGGLVGEA